MEGRSCSKEGEMRQEPLHPGTGDRAALVIALAQGFSLTILTLCVTAIRR